MLGVCYYPEHWPESQWEQDAAMMVELGLLYVRIGEFAWSRFEPDPGRYDFAWFDRAVEVLANAGLQIIIGTPTATPPKWLIDKYPDILPVDPNTGVTRGFGSRRHYDYASEQYLVESLRISKVLVERYGQHPSVYAWQTDNELSCHDTTLSASNNAKQGFQAWCKSRYADVTQLNQAWGNVFWSMEYRDFSEIELPVLAVTETSPAHQLAYRRYSSDRVIHFHNEMIKVLREGTDRPITHNFIPTSDTQTDNYALAAELDFVAYDNYPLGRSDLFFADRPAQEFAPYIRTGHPDFATFYHDQTRALSSGDYWIMEQQPGPVNWAYHNPRPLPGMVRLWSLESFAHGADTLCFFRWRQAPFAQEQMHAGILRQDNSKATAWFEAKQIRDDVEKIRPYLTKKQSRIAIVNHVEAQWVSEIEVQGEGYDYFKLMFDYYSVLRQLGVDVDFVSPEHDLSDYSLVIVPCLPMLNDSFVEKVAEFKGIVLFGPRSGSKTDEFSLAPNLAPGKLQDNIQCKVLSVETLRPDCPGSLHYQNQQFESGIWREELDAGSAEVIATYENSEPAIVRQGRHIYVGTQTCQSFLRALFSDLCQEVDVATYALPEGLRLSRRGQLTFAFNYSNQTLTVPHEWSSEFLIGSNAIAPQKFSVWVES